LSDVAHDYRATIEMRDPADERAVPHANVIAGTGANRVRVVVSFTLESLTAAANTAFKTLSSACFFECTGLVAPEAAGMHRATVASTNVNFDSG